MLGSPDLVMDLPVRLFLRRANPDRLGNLLALDFSLDQGTALYLTFIDARSFMELVPPRGFSEP
jgi:hypothetical protein